MEAKLRSLQDRAVGLLTDWKQFATLTRLILLFEAALSALIILKVPC
jgi:hypothetical protein